jgi:hypothetical protein
VGPPCREARLIEIGERARRRALLVLGAAVAVGLAAWAATTTPFTAGADAVTAIGLGLIALEVALHWRHVPATAASVGSPGDRARWWPWLVLTAVVVAWELVCLFLGPRVAHPTISSLYDSAAHWQAVKAACFFAWLCLGAALVRS